MDLTYKVIGGDGNEYGPVTLEQLQGWITAGRVTGETKISRSDQNTWAAAATFPELKISAPEVSQPAAPVANTDTLRLEHQMKSGASWFYWIAGLSIINSVASISGSQWGFIAGLGITRIIDAIGSGMGSSGLIVAGVLDFLAAGIFILFGLFAHKQRTWSFIVGMILYALDGLIFLVGPSWISLGFHAFVLYCLFNGFKAAKQLKALANR